MKRAWLFVTCLAACGVLPPPLPPAPDGSTCETAAANLAALGGCDQDPDLFVADCHDAEAASAEIGVRLPVSCFTHAATCAEVFQCRP